MSNARQRDRDAAGQLARRRVEEVPAAALVLNLVEDDVGWVHRSQPSAVIPEQGGGRAPRSPGRRPRSGITVGAGPSGQQQRHLQRQGEQIEDQPTRPGTAPGRRAGPFSSAPGRPPARRTAARPWPPSRIIGACCGSRSRSRSPTTKVSAAGTRHRSSGDAAVQPGVVVVGQMLDRDGEQHPEGQGAASSNDRGVAITCFLLVRLARLRRLADWPGGPVEPTRSSGRGRPRRRRPRGTSRASDPGRHRAPGGTAIIRPTWLRAT